MSSSKMTYNKFLAFMKNFGLFNQQVTKEMVSITYARRCPNKAIDFAAFIDILFKISKTQFLPKGYNLSCETRFQVFLDLNVLNKHLQILDKPQEHKTPRFPFFNHRNNEEMIAAIMLEQNNELLNHVRYIHSSSS